MLRMSADRILFHPQPSGSGEPASFYVCAAAGTPTGADKSSLQKRQSVQARIFNRILRSSEHSKDSVRISGELMPERGGPGTTAPALHPDGPSCSRPALLQEWNLRLTRSIITI